MAPLLTMVVMSHAAHHRQCQLLAGLVISKTALQDNLDGLAVELGPGGRPLLNAREVGLAPVVEDEYKDREHHGHARHLVEEEQQSLK